jgi:hypothetical protein
MGQVLRITFNNKDYHYQVLNISPVSKETREIQVLLDGATYTLAVIRGQWLPRTRTRPISQGCF